MAIVERLVEIIKRGKLEMPEEDVTLDEALKYENQVMVAFLERRISLEEYNRHIKATNPITHTEFEVFASESYRHK